MDKNAIKSLVDEALNKVYSGNMRENKGSIENHSTKNSLQYFKDLAGGNTSALNERESIINELKNIDTQKIIKDIDE